MQTWTAVTPSTMTLPPDLALLVAPVSVADAPRSIEGSVGHAEGVVLDDAGALVGFFVRLSPTLVAGSPRTLVPASALAIAEGSALVLAWPQEKLLAQRRLDDDLQHYQASSAAGPGEGKVDVSETLKEGVEGSAIGAIVGGVLGGLAGGPLLGLALAAFFGTGGGLVGFIAGGAQETHASPPGAKPDNLGTEPENAAFSRLQARLGDPELPARGLVHVTRFSPQPATAASAQVAARAS